MMKCNVDDIKSFVNENDIFVVDRGFRDSISLLEELGIKAAMPTFMKKGEKQMSDADANTSRMVTKRHIRVMHWVTGGNMENLMKSVVGVTVINTQYKEPGTAVLPKYVRPSQCSTEEAVGEADCRITGVTPADFEDEEVVEVEEVYYEALTPREMAQRQREEYVSNTPFT
ncbi:unnamed protein product [Mytilus edulis]|uniref:DDE Tnp4 domain-containing protein n=1 Tax=Mytilus edulis TaxID=6550 RepID=A0A8S3UEQ7_MYTED|nr:unnamed protein product [Mytilus edulis]